MTEQLHHWQPYPGDTPGEHTVVGTVHVLRQVESARLGNARDIFVYLPPSYHASDRRYPVVYMHDGQNLFDAATSFGAEWEVDQVLEAASADGLECIVVGICNAEEDRANEYSPWPDTRHQAGGRGGDYVDWLVDEVKPMVDADFRTRPERVSTGIAGSSLGGLISLYGFFQRPECFGFVGAMSPAFWFGDRRIYPFVEGARRNPGRIYLDAGTREGQEVLGDVREMKALLQGMGYEAGRNLLTVVEPGGRHDEESWGRRLRRSMHFLLDVPVPARR